MHIRASLTQPIRVHITEEPWVRLKGLGYGP